MDKKQLLEQVRREVLRRAATTDYYSYVQYVHPRIYRPNRAAKLVCNTVQQFIEANTGNPYDILIVTEPPQHGKSMNLTETLPSWYLGNNPDKSVIEVSYNDTFAEKFGLMNRRKVEEYGHELFGIKIARDSRKKSDFELADRRGSMRSRGVKAGITGNPCHLMIIDDPIRNREEADSPAMRQKLIAGWHDDMKSRFAAGAKIILILTRWHEEDLAGYLIKNDPYVTVLRLPCECDSHDDPLGRQIGDALCPEIGKDNNWLQGFKRSMTRKEGTRSWNALYQGKPSSEQGNLIRRDWWKWYDFGQAGPMAQTILSIDASFKGSEDNDFVAVQVWGKREADAYLLDSVKDHMDFPQTLKVVRQMAAKWPNARPIYIEDKANGPAVIAMLRHEIPGIVPVNPEGGKIARVNAIAGFIEAGNVYLPREVTWAEELVESCAAFPMGAHDDDVDAMSQGLNKLYFFHGELPEEEDPEERSWDDQVQSMFGL